MGKIIRFPRSKARPGKRRKPLAAKLDAMVRDERFLDAAIKAGLNPHEWNYLCELADAFDNYRKKI